MWIWGGARLRITRAADGVAISSIGRCGAHLTEHIESRIRELRPDGEGVIDVYYDRRARLRFRVTGPVASAEFVQRVRNVVVNL